VAESADCIAAQKSRITALLVEESHEVHCELQDGFGIAVECSGRVAVVPNVAWSARLRPEQPTIAQA